MPDAEPDSAERVIGQLYIAPDLLGAHTLHSARMTVLTTKESNECTVVVGSASRMDRRMDHPLD